MVNLNQNYARLKSRGESGSTVSNDINHITEQYNDTLDTHNKPSDLCLVFSFSYMGLVYLSLLDNKHCM